MKNTERDGATSAARSRAGKIAALTRWAHAADPHAALAPARKGFRDRFEREVDPDGVLHPSERAIKADRARRVYMMQLASKSVESRRKKKAAKAE